MKKITIISYYDLKEHLLYIKSLFQDYYYEVTNYPLFQYAYDSNDKIENYKTHFDSFLRKDKSDIILWWFLDVPLDVFKYIKDRHPDVYFIMFNSDDPCNINAETMEKAKIFDLVVTPCKDSIKKYIIHTTNENVIFNPFGYDPNYFYPLEHLEKSKKIKLEKKSKSKKKGKYTCDISFVLHTLYIDEFFKNQCIQRRKLIDTIIELVEHEKRTSGREITFKLFGSYIINEYYPDYYHGDIEYINLNKLFNKSKINICTHPFGNKELSISDMEIKIIGSGGLLYIDNIKGIEQIFHHNINCIVIDPNAINTQILDILDNKYDTHNIKANAYETSKDFTWDNWIIKIHVEISKYYFDADTYSELIDLGLRNSTDMINTIDKEKCWDHWLSYGLKNKIICYNFSVPDNFNAKEYANDNIDLNGITNSRKLYLDWYLNGKNPDYLYGNKALSKSELGNLGTIETYNISTEQWFELNTIFNQISKSESRDTGLLNLQAICKNNPRIKINELLELYVKLCNL